MKAYQLQSEPADQDSYLVIKRMIQMLLFYFLNDKLNEF